MYCPECGSPCEMVSMGYDVCYDYSVCKSLWLYSDGSYLLRAKSECPSCREAAE